MNIKVQCCGLVLLILLAIIYKRNKKLDLHTGRLFLCCFYGAFVGLILDVLSIFGIVYRAKIPAFLPEFLCRLYPASLIVIALLTVVYVAAGVTAHVADYKKALRACIAFAAVVILFIFVLPIEMYEDARGGLAWTDGPSIYVAYFGLVVFFVLNLVQIMRHRAYIYDRQRRTVLIWLAMWLAAAFIQGMLHNHVLIAGFASALGITVVFIQFENPELNLDRNSGLFNYVAYTRYGEQLYAGNRKFYAIAITFENLAWQDTQDSGGSVRTKRMLDSFLKIPDAKAFRIMENEVLLIFTNEMSAKSAWNDFKEHAHAESIENNQGYMSYYYVEDPRCVSSHRELLEVLQYAGYKKKDTRLGGFYTVDRTLVSQMISERMMTQQIVEAMEEDRILVYYQPIYSVEEKCFTSAEALVRLVDRDGKVIPPGAFVPVAESNGMIIEIGRRVFEKVCKFYQENRLEEYGVQYIDVNLSIVQCADEKLADNYIEIMNEVKIDPRRLNLEITESASLREKEVLISNMERMIEYGMRFSLDDFGTGKSNLDYFVDMPVKIVKFDKEMIQAYFVSNKARYVMDAAMSMIHGMGLEIVAEGIETEEQYKMMEVIKINFIQGYYFSKPLPEQELLSFLRRENLGVH